MLPDLPPPDSPLRSIRVRPLERTDDEADEVHGRADHRDIAVDRSWREDW